MTRTCDVWINGQLHKVCISDEPEALLAAEAAGRAVLGVGEECAGTCPWLSTFIRSWDEMGETALQTTAERLVRRKNRLPWVICETERLIIREAAETDLEQLDFLQIKTFENREAFTSYISCQYGFYEYGLWLLEEKTSGSIVGAAGVWNPEDSVCHRLKAAGEIPEDYLEMGYQIAAPYQRKGLAREACQAIMTYTDWELECRICLQVDKANLPSQKLAESLGFWRIIPRTDSEGTQWPYLYGWSC